MAVFRSCNLIAHKCREVISLSTPSNSVLTPLEEAEIFGMLLSQCRSVTKLSQNYISSIAKYDHRSLQKVEKGTQLPGIINAVKLVMATGVDAGVFFDIFSENLKTIKVKKRI